MPVRFSVVIPTYNRASSVLTTLQSCFAQQFTDFEIIVVDDGSTDNTLEVLKEVADPRLTVVSQTNAGPAAARNHGMRKATGQYIAFLDSDDSWYPGFLEAADQLLVQQGDVVIYGQIVVDRGVGKYWIKPDRALGPEESLENGRRFLHVARSLYSLRRFHQRRCAISIAHLRRNFGKIHQFFYMDGNPEATHVQAGMGGIQSPCGERRHCQNTTAQQLQVAMESQATGCNEHTGHAQAEHTKSSTTCLQASGRSVCCQTRHQ